MSNGILGLGRLIIGVMAWKGGGKRKPLHAVAVHSKKAHISIIPVSNSPVLYTMKLYHKYPCTWLSSSKLDFFFPKSVTNLSLSMCLGLQQIL